MAFTINNVGTVWLPFNTEFNVCATIFASWTETIIISDPNNLTNSAPITGTGTPMAPIYNQQTFTTPSSYGNFPGYPVNVTITNNGGSGGINYVNVIGLTVISYDHMNNNSHNNANVSFIPLT
jgi:hypothetical protein